MKIYFDKNKSKQVLADTGQHIIKTDQPEMAGGHNEAPAPFNLFLASLGTCAGIYIKNFCDQRGIDASEITLDQKVDFHPIKQMINRIRMIINVPADFPEKYDNALIKSAEQCAVKRHLHSDIEMKTRVERN
ncbi:MAG TPA: OsmC family protein [Bacteroidales bacterium]|nr:OsmC family protein [Bacteroidales bacterium]